MQTVKEIQSALLGYNVSSYQFKGFTDAFIAHVKTFDLIFNICYGLYKKDDFGFQTDLSQVDIVKWLDDNNIKHNTSKYHASLMAMDKSTYPQLVKDIYVLYSPTNAVNCHIESEVIKKPKMGACHRDMALLSSSDEIGEVDPNFIYQEYIKGREFSVFVISNKKGINVLKPYEVISNEGKKVFTFGNKTSYDFNPIISKPVLDNINRVMYELHHTIDFKGLTRTDLKLDANNNLFLLDINSMPNMDRKFTVIEKVLDNSGISYDEMIEDITEL